MLFGNDGFMTPGIENLAVDGCKVSYETDGGFYSHAIQRIYVSYDLNKANWRSAVYQPDYYNDIVRFEIFGELGLRKFVMTTLLKMRTNCVSALVCLA